MLAQGAFSVRMARRTSCSLRKISAVTLSFITNCPAWLSSVPAMSIRWNRNSFHSPARPVVPQYQSLHERVQVECEDHDPPPGCILAKICGWKLPACQILLLYRVHLFALAASLVQPAQNPVAGPWQVCYRTEDLVLLPQIRGTHRKRLKTATANCLCSSRNSGSGCCFKTSRVAR